MTTIPLLRRLSALAGLLAGLLLTPAHGAGPAAPSLLIDTGADGQRIAVLRTRHGLEVMAMQHRTDAVASDCLRLESGPTAGTRRSAPVLRNHCDHPLTVSYCIDADDRGDCAARDSAAPASTPLAAGASLRLPGRAAADAEVRWIACRHDAGATSTLIDGGRRGECLAPARDSELADARD